MDPPPDLPKPPLPGPLGRRKVLNLWWQLTRASAIVMTAVVSLSLSIVGAGGHLSASLWAHVLFSSLMLVGVSYGSDLSNMVYDGLREDSVHQTKKFRPVPMRQVDPEVVLANATSIWLVTGIIAALFYGPYYTAALLATAFTAYIYSAPPRTKNGIVSNGVGITLPRSLFGPMAAFLAGSGGTLGPSFWYVLAISVPLVLLAGEIRNLEPDATADRTFGVRTISNTYGEWAGWAICITGMVLAPILAFTLGLMTSDPFLWGLAIPPVLMVAAHMRGWSRHITHQIYHYSFVAGILAYSAPWLIKAAGL